MEDLDLVIDYGPTSFNMTESEFHRESNLFELIEGIDEERLEKDNYAGLLKIIDQQTLNKKINFSIFKPSSTNAKNLVIAEAISLGYELGADKIYYTWWYNKKNFRGMIYYSEVDFYFCKLKN